MVSTPFDTVKSTTQEYLSALLAALGLVLLGFLLSSLFQYPLIATLSLLDIPVESGVGSVGVTLVQGVAFVVVVVSYSRYADHPNLLVTRWPSMSNLQRTLRDICWVVFGFAGLLIFSRLSNLILQQFGFSVGTNQIIRAVEQSPTLALAMVLLSILVVGPSEELLFRGGAQGIFRRVFRPIPAIISSSALFGLAHATAVVASSSSSGIWGYVVSAFVLGLILGGLYEYTNNILIPIVVHGAYNALVFFQYV
ncbi:CPBP family intramembrane glutamic endopeptidase [Halococcus hamelinensis]|uniref:CPBP family intramembrane glutamic endopeptidase n=1 Tax=Halococcus hamelinensis TaxID=332168 RepID=UPI0009A21BDA|nr:CPBP family intramembrane glutamic endopeptidase [Halococcus hamelinensis]